MLGWRRVLAFVAQFTELDAAQHLVERGRTPHGLFGQFRAEQVEVGAGLGRRGAVSLDCALWHRDLADRHDRRAVTAIEHVQAALLGWHDDRRLDAVLGLQVHQGRLAADVHVPQVVVGELVVPAGLASGKVQGDHAGTVLLGTWSAVGAVLVGRLVAQRQVDHAEVFIDAGQRPHVGRVAAVGLARRQWLGVVRVVAVPVPDQAAIVHVVGADHAGGLVGRLVVGDMTADDHQAAGDRRG